MFNFTVSNNTANQKKIFTNTFAVILISFFIISQAYSQNWSSLGGGTAWVNAMTVYNGELIVGTVSGITKWNGSTWSDVGTGVNGEVDALAIYNGELYAGGRFTIAGGVAVSYMAKWNGTAWFDVEGGTDSYVVSMTVYNNELIIGGYFLNANIPANYIAKWNGTSWSPLGSGMGGSQGQVMALTVYNGNLIAGGFFSTAGGSVANRIAQWNGSSWSVLGSGINNVVYALTVYNGNLIAGGLFANAGGNSANDIASWNGNSWSNLGAGVGGGFYPYVLSLTTYGNDLYVAGLYTIAGNLTTNGIAKWNGSTWSGLGSGFFNTANVCGAYASTIYNNNLVCGGIFSGAGGNGAGNIAQWDGIVTGLHYNNHNTPDKFQLHQNYPNPFNPSTNIKFDVARSGNISIKIYDMQGREVAVLVNENLNPGSYNVSFNASNLPSGSYFFRLEAQGFSQTNKMILVK
jgi:hypothetical protein